jgi:hypothetical protein
VQELYRVRVAHALEAARELFRRDPSPAGPDLLALERAGAVETLRDIDRDHERRVAGVRAEFEERWRLAEREGVAAERRALARLLADCPLVCVAGGHVAILLDVLLLFDFGALVGERALACWSAGAMALSERVVLFHDDPPQGGSSAEVLEAGLGLIPRLLPLPHARTRLKLDDRARVALFALRFRPLIAAPLDERTGLVWTGRRWRALESARKMTEEGELAEIAR